MVSAFDFGSSGPGSSPGRGQCVMFLGKTLYSYNASLHTGMQMCTSDFYFYFFIFIFFFLLNRQFYLQDDHLHYLQY